MQTISIVRLQCIEIPCKIVSDHVTTKEADHTYNPGCQQQNVRTEVVGGNIVTTIALRPWWDRRMVESIVKVRKRRKDFVALFLEDTYKLDCATPGRG
jgi:hypothetical protein